MLKAVLAVMVLLGLDTFIRLAGVKEFLEFMLGAVVMLALVYMFVTITMYYRRESSGVDARLFSGEYLRRFPGFIIASTIVGLMIFLGSILLIIPGIVVSLGASLLIQTYYYEKLGIIASIKESFSKTRGYKMNIFVVSIPLIIVYILAVSSDIYTIMTGKTSIILVAMGIPFRALMLTLALLVSVEIYSRIVKPKQVQEQAD